MKDSKLKYFLFFFSTLIIFSPTFLQNSYGDTINYYYEENTTCATTTTDNENLLEVTDVTDFDFISGKKYLIIAQGQFNGDTATDNIGLEVGGGITALQSIHMIEPTSVANSCGDNRDMYTWLYFDVFTSDGSESPAIESNVGGGSQLLYDNLSIFIMNLSDDITENTDWYYDTGGADTSIGTSWDTDDDATITFTPGNANDIWFVLGSARIDVNSVSVDYSTRLYSTHDVDYPIITQQGEDAANNWFVQTLMRTYQLPASSVTFEIESQGTTTTGERDGSKVFALNLSKFKDVSFTFNDSSIGLTTTEYGTELSTFEHTPTNSGDNFVMFWGHTTQSSTFQTEYRLDIEETDVFPDHSFDFNMEWGSADALPIPVFSVENLGASAQTIDVDASEVSGDTSVAFRSLVAFSMELLGTDYTETPSDNLSITDSVTAIAGEHFEQSDNLSITDNVSRIASYTVSISDDLSITDNAGAICDCILDPPKRVSSTVTSSDATFTWLQGETNGGTHVSYIIQRYFNNIWTQISNQGATTFVDDHPLEDTPTAQYRVGDYNGISVACWQYAMNSTVISNLQTHLPLCTTPNDNGLLDNDGTITGGYSYTNKPAFNLTGSNYITLGGLESDYDFTNTDPFTISYWIKYNATGNNPIIEKDSTVDGSDGWGAYTNDDNLCFHLESKQACGLTSISPNTWAFFTAVKGTVANLDDLDIYVNGVFDVSGTTNALSTITNNDNVTIGTIADGSIKTTAEIYDVMIFDKALDAHEVHQLYLEYIDTDDISIIPNAVEDLTVSSMDFGAASLDWTTPSYVFGNIIGYMINYTTPLGDPTTIVTNSTGSQDTESVVFNLMNNATYSFRVSPVTVHGTNSSGNIANATINSDFVIGDLDFETEINPDQVEISFARTDLNSSAIQLDVNYGNSMDLACAFDYKFGQTNQTYTGLDSVTLPDNSKQSSFILSNSENEVVNILCWDQNNVNSTGRYIVTQSNFPLLVLLDNFQNGTFGTEGMFGVIDFITLSVIILSMLAFNRSNGAAGAVISIIIVGSLSYFGIIELQTIILSALAVIVMLAIFATRKA